LERGFSSTRPSIFFCGALATVLRYTVVTHMPSQLWIHTLAWAGITSRPFVQVDVCDLNVSETSPVSHAGGRTRITLAHLLHSGSDSVPRHTHNCKMDICPTSSNCQIMHPNYSKCSAHTHLFFIYYIYIYISDYRHDNSKQYISQPTFITIKHSYVASLRHMFFDWVSSFPHLVHKIEVRNSPTGIQDLHITCDSAFLLTWHDNYPIHLYKFPFFYLRKW
jgi:hypothetical protein